MECFLAPSRGDKKPLKSVGTEEWHGSHSRSAILFVTGICRKLLVDAALERLEADGAESISLRDLARDAGVNHRAVYRHFPDKLSLLASVAQTGWKRLAQRLRKSTAGKAPGQPTLAAAGVGFFLFARENSICFT